MKKLIYIFLILFLSIPAFSQGVISKIGKGFVKAESAATKAALRPVPPVPATLTIPQMASRVLSTSVAVGPKEIRHWNELAADDFYDADRMLSEYFILRPENSPSKELVERTQVLQEKIVRNYLNRSYYLSEFKRPPTVSAVAGNVDYLEYIPYRSRVIMLGEMHEYDWMIKEVEQAIYQYKNAYPDKNVYYLSEFVNATPGEETYLLSSQADVERLVTKRPYYKDLTNRMIQAGLNVVGLENPELSLQLVKQGGYSTGFHETELAWKAISAASMEERNIYWSDIARKILLEDPDAVLFIHAGFGHTGYNQVESLPWQLKEFSPFVVEFTEPKIGDFNMLLEQSVPRDIHFKSRQLQQQNPYSQIRAVVHFADKRAALVSGCDLNIRRMENHINH